LEEYVFEDYIYELNLVLKDGKRLNVMDHSRRAHIRSDAQRLGQFLKVPIWDAIFEEV
jgi:Fe2+ transport system protein B